MYRSLLGAWKGSNILNVLLSSKWKQDLTFFGLSEFRVWVIHVKNIAIFLRVWKLGGE